MAAVTADGPSGWARRSFTVLGLQENGPQGVVEEGSTGAAV